MRIWSNRLGPLVRLVQLVRDRRGVAAVEFALVAPVLIVIAAGLTDMGRAVVQSAALEKGLRVGALYAARNEFPLSAAVQTEIENLVKTGDPTGAAPYLVSGWGEAGADLTIETFDFDVNGTPLPVVRLRATVPYKALMPGLIPNSSFDMKASHEQAYIGD